MSMSDPLGDMITRIRNAQRSRHTQCVAPASKMRASVLEALKREGFIRGYSNEELRPGVSQLRIERAQGKTGADAEEGAGAVGEQTPFVLEGAPEGTVFSIFRKEEHGGSLHYHDFAALEADFAAKKVHPKDLKTAVADAIVRLLDPIRKTFEADEEWQKVEKLAYPDPNAKPEKKKKVRAGCLVVLVRLIPNVVVGQSIPPSSPGEGQEREACGGCGYGCIPGRGRLCYCDTIRRRGAFCSGGCEAGGFVMTM